MTSQESETPKEPESSDYRVLVSPPTTLSSVEIDTCIDILKAGGAVEIAPAKRNIPRARLLAVVRHRADIVATGAVKDPRPWYAKRISGASGVIFPFDTRELGYVAVRPDHWNKGLSLRVVRALLDLCDERLFATTYSDYMKRTLAKAGFARKGKEWRGRTQMLSFWENR